MLFGALALIALFLALAGIYAASAYSVLQRTHEFGIRKAIGASDGVIVGEVMLKALRQSAIGIAIGLALTAAVSRLIVSILFQTSPLDPLTYVVVVMLLVGCTVLAALIPAVRATRVQPAVALRFD
jgi:putative ABC transport system permease protein